MKTILKWIAASARIMFIPPLMAIRVINGDAGMAVMFILWFVIYPVWSVIIGAAAGRNGRLDWILPVLSAVFFLVSSWLYFDRSEPLFAAYASGYLVLGIASMLTAAFIRSRRKE